MRISDWSSDVCSSDLVVLAAGALEPGVVGAEGQPVERAAVPVELDRIVLGGGDLAMGALGALEGVGRAQRVLVVQAPVGAGRELVQFAVQRQVADAGRRAGRSEEHTSELQSLMRISYDVFCLKKKNKAQDYIDRVTL